MDVIISIIVVVVVIIVDVVVVVVDIVALIFFYISFRRDAINDGSSEFIGRDPIFPATAFPSEAC